MKSKALSIMFVVMLVVFTSNANATHPDELYYGADCEGWSFTGHFYFGQAATVDVSYDVELYQGTELVYSFNGFETVMATTPDFLFSGMWNMELCGDYVAKLHLYFVSSEGYGNRYGEVAFTCECNGGGECTFTPGFWKNHPEDWPVEMLTIGDDNYTKEELLAIFDYPTVGDITVKLFHHLVAAKLNVLNGSDPAIQEYIDMGDEFFRNFALLSFPMGEDKENAEYIKDKLEEYNEIPCEEEEEMDHDFLIKDSGIISFKSGGGENTSWGALKKIHQD